MPAITSRRHPIVQSFRRAARGDADAALIDGWHLLSDAHRAGIQIETVAITGEPPDRIAAQLVHELGRTAKIVSVSTAVMDAISPVRAPAGIAALIRKRPAGLASTLPGHRALVIVPVDLQDPGNAGAIIRAAEGGGATGVVFSGASVDPWGWKALRAAMGSTFRLPVVREPDVTTVVASLRDAGLRLVATTPRGGRSMHDADLTGRIAILLGGEGDGLPRALVDAADASVSIPMEGGVESLNAAVAAAVLVYEARRQRLAGRAAVGIRQEG